MSGQALPVVAPVVELADACDCHMHVYDRRYPVAAGATLRPADASVDDYRRVQRALGTRRVVVVTPSTYGTDNRITVDAIAALGTGALGVAVVGPDVTDAELARLHRRGIRGIRFNLTLPAPVTLADIPTLARRIAALGWHVQLNLPPAWLPDAAAMLAALPVPMVFDHYGHLPLEGAQAEPAFRTIAALLEAGKAWVKLSGPYIESRTGAPDYADVQPLAARYLALAPERMVWGSDWPHPTVQARGGEPVDDAATLRTFIEWCGAAALAEQVLVRNPQTLYASRT